MVIAAALAVLAAVAYAPSLRLSFVNYDDNEYVLHNDHVRSGLSWDTVRWAFASPRELNYFPLTWISLAADASTSGPADADLARAMHRTNVALHAGSVAVLFLFLALATGNDLTAAFAAAAFAVHPVHVESVAWISERKDVLCGLFYMMAVMAHMAFARATTALLRRVAYVSVVLAGIAALLSKPMAVTLPVVLLLVDYWPLRRFAWGPAREHLGPAISVRRAIGEQLPLVVASVVVSWVTYLAQASAGAVQTIGARPMAARLQHVPVDYIRYLAKSVWPTGLSPYYPYHPQVSPIAVAGCVSAIAVVALFVVWSGRRLPYLPLGWLWFCVTLGPVIGVVTAGRQSIADRYLYLPLIGPIVMLAWGGADLMRRSGTVRVVAGVAAAVILVAGVAATWRQIHYWSDSRMLFAHALDLDPENAFAHAQLGYLDKVDGQLATARWHYEQAVRLDPEYGDATYNLANMMLPTDAAAAARYYRMTLAVRPHDARVENNLGVAILSADPTRAAEAADLFRAAGADSPGWPDPHVNLGKLYLAHGRTDLAAVEFAAAGRRP